MFIWVILWNCNQIRTLFSKTTNCLFCDYRPARTVVCNKGEQILRKRLDLTGQRFGKLTALRPAESIGTYTLWVCRCDCGQETVVRTSNLRSGRSKSCGCGRRAIVKEAKIRSMNKNNTSGVAGVEWLPQKKRWKATICFNRKRYFLGHFPEFEDAVEARKRTEKARRQAEKDLHDSFLRAFASARSHSANDTSLAGKRKEQPSC